MRRNPVLIECEDFLVLHQDLSSANCGVNCRIYEAKDEMPEEICLTEYSRRLVIHDRQIRRATFREFSQTNTKLTFTNCWVVFQQKLGCFQKGDAWIMIRKSMKYICTSHLRQHIRRHAISS